MRDGRLATLDATIESSRPLCDYVRDWPMEDFGALFLADLSEFPRLAARLPRMPSEADQKWWTWFAGDVAIRRSVEIMRACRDNYERLSGRGLGDATVLDYGAGWGRLTRMLYQFVPEAQVYACDADPKSVALFNSLGFTRPCDQISPTPGALPYPDDHFDFVLLWSVLTHLPPSTADKAMRALRRVVAPTGLVLVTIRPAEFWTRNALVNDRSEAPAMLAAHERDGIAHLPFSPTWGDTSMSLAHITRAWPDWRVVETRDAGGEQVEVWLAPHSTKKNRPHPS